MQAQYYLFPSRSHPGAWRTIRRSPEGRWRCNCPATTECYHLRLIRDELFTLHGLVGGTTKHPREVIDPKSLTQNELATP